MQKRLILLFGFLIVLVFIISGCTSDPTGQFFHKKTDKKPITKLKPGALSAPIIQAQVQRNINMYGKSFCDNTKDPSIRDLDYDGVLDSQDSQDFSPFGTVILDLTDGTGDGKEGFFFSPEIYISLEDLSIATNGEVVATVHITNLRSGTPAYGYVAGANVGLYTPLSVNTLGSEFSSFPLRLSLIDYRFTTTGGYNLIRGYAVIRVTTIN